MKLTSTVLPSAFGFGECAGKIVLDPGEISAAPPPIRRSRRNVGFDLAQFGAEHAGHQAESEDDQDDADQQARHAQFGIARDAGQADEPQQVESRHREQHHPRGEETLARQEAGLQHRIEAVEILQHRGEHEEAHHDLHARQPFAGARQLLQILREQREQEKGQREAAGEDHHSQHGAHLVRADGRREQSAHEGSDAGERRQRECQAHQQRAEESALSGGRIEFGQHAGRDGDLKRAEQAQAEDEEDQRDESVDPGVGSELHDGGGPERERQDEAERAEENDDAEAESRRLSESAALPDEVRHGDRNHRENAGREDGGEAESEGQGEECRRGCCRRLLRGAVTAFRAALVSLRCSPREC